MTRNAMLLWTIHPEDFFDKSQKRGFIKADGRYIYRDFKDKYDWMVEKMLALGIIQKKTYPVWAWYAHNGKRKRPDLRCSSYLPRGTKGVCIEFDIDEKKVLLSLYHIWSLYVLNNFHFSKKEEEEAYYEKYPHLLTETVVRKSWDRIFDLNACSQRPDRAYERSIQACLPIVYNHQIRSVIKFVAR